MNGYFRRSVRLALCAVAVLAFQDCQRAPQAPTPVPAPAPPTEAACGVERWAVKTLADADALRVDPAHRASHGDCRSERALATLLRPAGRSDVRGGVSG